jgi:uncharacterized protein involved in exopolysaccharide biosynthesis
LNIAVHSAHLDSNWRAELKGYIAQLRRRTGFLAIVGLGFAALAVAYLLLVPARYRASTEVFLDPRGLEVVQNDVTPRLATSEVATSLVESQARIAQSEAMLLAVVDRLRLNEDDEFVGASLPEQIIGTLFPGPAEDTRTAAMRKLQRAINVNRASRSYVIVMGVESEDPIKAARIADALATIYIEREATARKGAAERVEVSLSSRLNELADRVRASEDAVESFKAQNNIIGSATKLISDQQLEDANTRLTAQHNTVVQLRARVEQAEKLLAKGADLDTSLEALQSPTIASLRVQYAQVMRRQASAQALLGPRHPDVQVIREQRDSYRRLIREELERVAEMSKTEYTRAVTSEDELKADLDRLKSTTIRQNEAMVRLRELERVAESNREIYRAFLVRAKEIGAQGDLDTSSTRIVSAAVAPLRPSGPRASLVLLAAVGGLIVAAAYVLLVGPQARGRA